MLRLQRGQSLGIVLQRLLEIGVAGLEQRELRLVDSRVRELVAISLLAVLIFCLSAAIASSGDCGGGGWVGGAAAPAPSSLIASISPSSLIGRSSAVRPAPDGPGNAPAPSG